MPRWESEFREAVEKQGGTVVSSNGNDDWEGWGAILAQKGDLWGAIGWSYGSCDVCDPYEDDVGAIDEDVANSLVWTTEALARGAYEEMLSRGW